ncbi:PP2C family protein-serine/threonine phosphatase [uncultured Streptomyces sp.]|uniref:PP2C family protein-serine/threonine phosphatase n=1 Tax=uncultured Streptomyces sp. TaxID=174707 RepID=UPI0026332958|nr:SpoIIE family protein phosphatase [uncultured Streptomyces sp.]
MCRTGGEPRPAAAGGAADNTGPDGGDGPATGTDAAFTALLEDSAEDLYEGAPCGYLSTLMDGTVAKVNATLLGWLGLERDAVVGRRRFPDLLTVGGKLYHETHFAPLLRMRGELSGIALELKAADGRRLPVLVSSVVKHSDAGEPLLIRTTVFDASDRRAYEEELLHGRREAELARAEAERERAEAELARAEAEAARTEAERARAKAERERAEAERAGAAAEAARAEAERAHGAARRAHRQSEADRQRLSDALAALQRSLVPSALPAVPGLEAAAHYHTASPDLLGGDFYDLFPLGGTRWGFFLGDVCGKGPEAASLTSLTRYTLRAAALHDPEPAAALTTLNAVLHERYAAGGDPRYCTAVFGILEPPGTDGRATVRLASGGHPPALVVRADGTTEYLHTPGGLLVGVLPTAPFTTAATTLGPGDTLLLYTDGLTEARTGPTRRNLFGDEALRDFAAGHAPVSADGVIGALTGLLKSFGDGLDDDTALLALGVPATPAPTTSTPDATERAR